MCIEERNVNGKWVFIFEDHNLAPVAWYQSPRYAPDAPALITLDRHTDTHLAFLCHMHRGKDLFANIPYADLVAEANRLCSSVNNKSDVENCVGRLRNDEQIDFAIRSRIISHAYVISHNTNPQFEMRSREFEEWCSEKRSFENRIRGIIPPRKPDLNYQMPENKIISLSNYHFDELGIYSEKERIDLSLEDVNLSARMAELSGINRSLFSPSYDMLSNFILDIDLDYFNTVASVNPRNMSVFYQLIRQSQIITIATEDGFVQECCLEGEALNVPYLLDRLLQHIDSAMSQNSTNVRLTGCIWTPSVPQGIPISN